MGLQILAQNRLPTKAIGEYGMESSTRETSSTNTMVLTRGRRTGRMRRTSSWNRMGLQMLAQNSLVTKAIGEHAMESSTREPRTAGRRADRRRSTSSPNGMNLQMLAQLMLHDFAALNSLPYLFIELQNLLRAPITQHTQITPNT